MKYRKLQIVTLLLVTAFVFSGSSQVKVTYAQTNYIESNFELWFFTGAGSRILEAYALYIKQAVAPLGIDIKVVAKPFGQFVGDLLHLTTGQPFDISQIRFGGTGPLPDFMWQYHSSQTSFGKSMYQLNNPDFQAFQEIDTGIKTADVDLMLEDLDFELNLTRRQERIDEFAELYMDKLLYDFPMVAGNFRVSMWAGYGGPQNERWFQNEGIFGSIALGAGWIEDIPEREGNQTSLRTSRANPNEITFDPIAGFDSETNAIVGPMTGGLLDFDFEFNAHPGIAYNFVNTDVVNYDIGNGTTQSVAFGNYTYFVRDDAWWSGSVDVDGNTIAPHKVDAEDFWFRHEIMQLENVIINGQQSFNSVLGTELASTKFANDTLKVYIGNGTYTKAQLKPDDFLTFGGIVPMPKHILGGDLTFTNATGTWIGDMYELDALGINPQKTEEWLNYATLEGSSTVGPYDIVELVDKEFRSYQFRDDYYFPNEWDAAANPDVLGGVFAPHLNSVNPEAFYWAYLDGSSAANPVKPTKPEIESVFHIMLEDTNSRLLAFESGSIDHFTASALGAQKVEDHTNNEKFVVKTVTANRGPELLVFNLLNKDLRKINVRKAIASVIDLDQLVKIHDGFASPHSSPVWPFHASWYKPFPVEFGYEFGRDLMREEGYVALDTNEPRVNPVQPPVDEIVETAEEEVTKFFEQIDEQLGDEFLVLLSGMAILSLSVLRRKRRLK